MVLTRHRLQVVASIATRLALGAYPLAFMLVFGWGYGKDAFDAAAAANNWANYLNVLLLSGFVLVPPAVARLGAGVQSDRDFVRDHVALARLLLAAGVVVACFLWAVVDRSFPAIAQRAGATLGTWFVLFALLALTQIPATLWLGIAQAAGQYRAAFAWIALPRALALLGVAGAALAGVGATTSLAAAVVLVAVGQWVQIVTARRALLALDPSIFGEPGRAGRVLRQNLTAGAIALVGMLVTIVPVTIIGRLVPSEVGHAHVIVTLSNAVGAVLVAAFFPLSLTLAAREREPRGLLRHALRVARRVALLTAAAIALGWLVFPACAATSPACTPAVFIAGSLVVAGAGLRLASLGVYHVAVYRGHPLYSLLSATIEAIFVVAVTAGFAQAWTLYALGAAFIAGGGLRVAVALTLEANWLGLRKAAPGVAGGA